MCRRNGIWYHPKDSIDHSVQTSATAATSIEAQVPEAGQRADRLQSGAGSGLVCGGGESDARQWTRRTVGGYHFQRCSTHPSANRGQCQVPRKQVRIYI